MSVSTNRMLKRIERHIVALGSDNNEVAQKAERYLIRYYGDRAVEQLIQATSDANENVRFRAAWALSLTRDSRVLDILLPLTQDISPVVRYEVIIALGNLEDEQVIAPLIEIMCIPDSEFYTDDAAAMALAKFGKRAIPQLLALLESSSSSDVKRYIASIFSDMGDDEQVIGALSKLLDSTDREVRAEAIESLTQIGTDNSLSVLHRVLNDRAST